MLANPVKLVIWDLDDTFWTGTLAEGGATVPQANVELVVTLAKRGIISSVCSKNDFAEARRVLEAHGVWSYFVFPRIEFAPKGAAIAALIEEMALRPDNVLFIDDNRLNLEEARHFAPALMVAHPDEILPVLLDLPQAAGKDDSALTRLHQYKQLEQKADDFAGSTLSNEDFLRQCDVRVEIDVDVESHLERVIELINRSNQLNFTKARVESPADRRAFGRLLHAYGIHAGIVKVVDKYGDYGIVGFFMSQRNAATNKLLHFVFSCRTMNMGIEQYVFEMLGEPECEIVPPVANGLKSFAKIDWIRPAAKGGDAPLAVSDAKLLLLGGCDLLQVATYCSTNRVEYVNEQKDGVMVRHDDLGFLLSRRADIVSSDLLPQLTCWTKEDALRFDADLADARIIIVSLWDAMKGDFILLDGEILVRLGPFSLAKFIRDRHDEAFLSRCKFLRLTVRQRLVLIERALTRMVELSPNAQARFLLGTNSRGKGEPGLLRRVYNNAAAAYCRRRSSFEFLSIDETVPENELLSMVHCTRKGYFLIAEKIIKRIGEIEAGLRHEAAGFADVIEDAEILTLSGTGLSRRQTERRDPAATVTPLRRRAAWRERQRARAAQA